jgi:hypothetical protein
MTPTSTTSSSPSRVLADIAHSSPPASLPNEPEDAASVLYRQEVLQICNHRAIIEDTDDVLELVGPRLRSLRQHRADLLVIVLRSSRYLTERML